MALGMGVMIRMLGSDQSTVEAVTRAMGKRIVSVAIDSGGDGTLRLGMSDGGTLNIGDAGRSCCESRYMRSDDDLASFVGSMLVGIETRDAPSVPPIVHNAGADDEWTESDSHEVQFLVVHTSGGELVCSTHNEHNGYYGGFSIEASYTEPSK